MNPSDVESTDCHDFYPLNPSFRPDQEETGSIALFDFDSYRVLNVLHMTQDNYRGKWQGMTAKDVEAYIRNKDAEDLWWYLKPEATTCRLLRPHVDDLPDDVCAVNMSESGDIVWTSADPVYDETRCTYYPSVTEYQLRRPVPTVLRSQLAVTHRFVGGTDKVVLVGGADPEKASVFKYRADQGNYGSVWGEIQLLSQLPQDHPHLVPLASLVLEEISGVGVVGFTTPFIPAESLDRQRPPGPFKLRWLRELMAVVDVLNLEYGIVHQDISDRNLFINPATNSILLLDFSAGAAIGHLGPGYYPYKPKRNDVKGVIIVAYLFVTRDPRYAFYDLAVVDEDDGQDRNKWVKHPDVELDHDASTFYDEVMAWAKKRRAGPQLTHYSQAPQRITLPEAPAPPKDKVVLLDERGRGRRVDVNSLEGYAKDRWKAGRPVISWRRPPLSKWDRSRTLLATGRYADEEPETPPAFIPVPDPKRGFPQPPVAAKAKTKADEKRKVYVKRKRPAEETDDEAGPPRRSTRRRANAGKKGGAKAGRTK